MELNDPVPQAITPTIEAMHCELNTTWRSIAIAKTDGEKRALRLQYQRLYRTLQIQEAISFAEDDHNEVA